MYSLATAVFTTYRWSEALHGIAGSPGVDFGGQVWIHKIDTPIEGNFVRGTLWRFASNLPKFYQPITHSISN